MKKKRIDKLSLEDKGLTNTNKKNLFQLQCLYLWNGSEESFSEEEEKTYFTLYLDFSIHMFKTKFKHFLIEINIILV